MWKVVPAAVASPAEDARGQGAGCPGGYVPNSDALAGGSSNARGRARARARPRRLRDPAPDFIIQGGGRRVTDLELEQEDTRWGWCFFCRCTFCSSGTPTGQAMLLRPKQSPSEIAHALATSFAAGGTPALVLG